MEIHGNPSGPEQVQIAVLLVERTLLRLIHCYVLIVEPYSVIPYLLYLKISTIPIVMSVA